MMDDQDIPFTEVPFTSSLAVSQKAMREAGCFTTFQARLNIGDEFANAGSKRAVNDYSRAFDLQRHNYAPCTVSPGGNMASLAYPEVLPERMELTAYTTELGFVHDGKREYLEEVFALSNDLKITQSRKISHHWLPCMSALITPWILLEPGLRMVQ
jgi:hypothetical protein